MPEPRNNLVNSAASEAVPKGAKPDVGSAVLVSVAGPLKAYGPRGRLTTETATSIALT